MPEEFKPRFDATINLGHVITFIGFIVTIFVSWSTLDKRVALLEQAAIAQRAVDSQQDQRLERELALMRQSLMRIEDKLDADRRGSGK
ncbi:MAG: hypothetical protein ACP5GC_07940 [Thiomonas sp.]